MEKKNKIEEMLDQLSLIMDFVDAQSGKIIKPENITPEVEAKLKKVEEDFEKFLEASEKVVELTELTKSQVLEGLKEFEELAKLNQMAESVVGKADPTSPEAIQKQKDVNAELSEITKDIPVESNVVLRKATEANQRAKKMLKSLTGTEVETLYDTPQEVTSEEDEEGKISDKAFRKRRRRHLKNLGQDKV